MLGTATVIVSSTLQAKVKVLREISNDLRGQWFEVEIITGIGGWNAPGKVVNVHAGSSMSNFVPVEPAPVEAAAPAPVEAPRFAADGNRSAASLIEEAAEVQRKLDAFSNDGPADRAIANISPNSSKRHVAAAGRRRFAAMDRDLRRYTELSQELAGLKSRIAQAKSREAKAERKANHVELSAADLKGATHIRDIKDGQWWRVDRVNRTTVRVDAGPGMDIKIPMARVMEFKIIEKV